MNRILILLIPFALYLKTLCPNLYWGDSGEFISVSHVLGIAHPPGYPLYVLIGKLFTLIPVGSIGFRVNIVSALFGALTVFMVYLLSVKLLDLTAPDEGEREGTPRLRPSFIGGAFSAIVFAFSFSHWSQSVVAEVYTLNAFFFSLMIYICLIWWEGRNLHSNPANLFLLSFILGLGFSNHQSIVLSAPICLLFFITAKPLSIFNVKNILLSSLFFLLGMSVYTYLPIRSRQNPPLDWGNPENLSSFLDVFLRREYGGMDALNLSWEGILYTLATFDPLYEFTVPFICILAFSLIWFLTRKGRRPLFLFLFGLFSINLLGMVAIMVTNLEPWSFTRIPLIGKFFLIPYIIFAILCGIGFYALFKAISSDRWSIIKYNSQNPGRYLVLVIGIVLIANLIIKHYKGNDKSYNYYANSFGQHLLDSIEKDGVIFSICDNYVNALKHFQNVEKRRPDIVHISRAGLKQIEYIRQLGRDYPHLNVPIIKTTSRSYEDTFIKKVVENNSRLYPLYLIPHTDNIKLSKRLISEGVIFRISDKTEADTAGEMGFENRIIRFYNSELSKNNLSYFDDYTICAYSEIFLKRGLHYSEKGMFQKSVKEFKRVAKINPFFPGGHNNLGISLAKTGKRSLAKTELQESISLNPLNPKANSNMGICYMKEGNFNEAIFYFNRSLKFAPRSPEVYNNLGYCYVQKSLYYEARGVWEKALKINPNLKQVQKNLQRLTELGY